jgi:hypothetical protein
MRRFKKSELEALTECPDQGAVEWLAGAEDSVSYLKVNAENDELVIYASAQSVLVHGVLAPTSKVTPPDGHDLQHGSFPMADDCWAIQRVWGGGQGHRMYLEPPLSSWGSKSFEGGEKLIYRRSFDGAQQSPTPIELSQKLVHSLDLYFVPERNAYCRLDRRGEIEDVIKVIQRESADMREALDVVTILRKDLDKFMALSETSLVLRFDFTRVRWGSFGGWGEVERYERDEPDLFYHGGKNGQGSYANGAIIVRPKVTVDELVQAWKDEEDPKKRQYAKFKIYDRKNKTNVETSCAPEFLSNYFQKSDLPWEVSPAFFRPEVLLRFKADPERFTLEDRSITCRRAWHLKTFDINEAGQVHSYIGYLADLPYEEQIYWQSFNEWPQGSISERAHQTDILGEWDTAYDPLNSLKHTIRKLDKSPPEWWNPRGEALSDATRYPATDSPKEWADEILALDQFLVEGFLGKPLRMLAEVAGRKLDPNWGPLKVMQEVLVAKGRSGTEAKAVVAPMQRVHALRTEVKGHATPDKRRKAEIEARTKHGSFRSHFTQLAAECDKALNEVLSAFGIVLES